MSSRMNAICTISLMATLSALGCTATTGSADGESVGQSNDPLSVYQWSSDYTTGGDAFAGASIATLTVSGTEETVMVHTGDDRGNVDLYWSKYDGSWSDDYEIPSMKSRDPAQIAAFNGKIYLVHTGENDNHVWMSRLDTSTWTWNQDFMLPYTSYSTPAIASYNGSLYIVGSTPGTGQVWQATMSTSETFSGATDIAGVTFRGTPSLTVHCASTFCYPATLFMAYSGPNNTVMMSGLQATFSRRGVNSTWWTPWIVQNTDGSSKLTTTPPAIVSYGGNLHMVRTVPALADLIEWTYYDGSSWSNDVSIASQQMFVPSQDRFADPAKNPSASLSARSNMLMMVHLSSTSGHDNTWGNSNTAVYAERFW